MHAGFYGFVPKANAKMLVVTWNEIWMLQGWIEFMENGSAERGHWVHFVLQ